MLDYIQKGGPLMWLILACSVLAVGIFLERWTYFHRATIRVGEFLRGLANLIARQNYAEALHESAGTPGPVARVIHAALVRHHASRAELKEIVQEAGQLEMPKLERRLALLATIAFVSPMVGLLGTVTGLIEVFGVLSAQSGFATSADLASGIYQSLLTTAAGIAVAIPSAVAYAFLSSRVDALMHDMERAGIEMLDLLGEQADRSGIIEFQAEIRRSRTP